MSMVEKAKEIGFISDNKADLDQSDPSLVNWDQLLASYTEAGFNAELGELQEILDGKKSWNKDHVRVLIKSINDWLYFRAKADEAIPQIRLTSTRMIDVYFPYAQSDPEPKLENGRLGKYGLLG